MRDVVENHDSDEDSGVFFQKLRAHLYRWDCSPAHRLNDYYFGFLGGKEKKAIEEHLSTCMLCREDIEVLADFLKEKEPQPKSNPLQDALSKIYYLAFSPAHAAPLPVGVRGGKDSPQRFTFETVADGPAIELFLGLREMGDKYQLNGQFEMDEAVQTIVPDAQVEITNMKQVVSSTVVDELGTFMCLLESKAPFMMKITAQGGGVLYGRINLS